jgi:cytidylate kinase
MTAHFEDVLADIRARDERDSGRDVAPLKPAADAILLDTSGLDPDQAVGEALRLAEEQLVRLQNPVPES